MSFNKPAGLTLIELLVAMTIIGILFAVSAVALRSAFDVNLKNGSRQLSNTLRYLHNKAVLDHQYLRMVYDFEKQSYWAEQSSDAIVVAPPEEKKPESSEGEGEKKKPAFTASESKLLQETSLPSGVFFKDVLMEFVSAKQEGGQAFTYFFPDGFATGTVIHLRDEEDQNEYSVSVQSLTGEVQVEIGYIELKK